MYLLRKVLENALPQKWPRKKETGDLNKRTQHREKQKESPEAM